MPAGGRRRKPDPVPAHAPGALSGWSRWGNRMINEDERVEGFEKWTSREVAHSLPAEGRRSILPARYVSTLCSRHPIWRARSASVSHSSPALEKHWHGATASTAMTHIAILERLDGKTVDWMEKVSDEEYRAGVKAE